jgi:hypothetical protein
MPVNRQRGETFDGYSDPSQYSYCVQCGFDIELYHKGKGLEALLLSSLFKVKVYLWLILFKVQDRNEFTTCSRAFVVVAVVSFTLYHHPI